MPQESTGAPAPDRRRSGWAVGVPVMLLLAGFLFATSATTAGGTDLRGSGTADLAAVIRRRALDVERRARTVRELQAEIDQLSLAAGAPSQELSAVRDRRAALAPLSGSTSVRGPGLQVTLRDAVRQGTLPDGVSPDDVVVHQQDVQGVVNALWAGGAEAMSIQDQRVVSTSAVRCVGNTLILQGRVYSPPYLIRAVGPVDRLQASLSADRAVGAYREAVQRFGLGYEVRVIPLLTLPAYEGDVELDYARLQS